MAINQLKGLSQQLSSLRFEIKGQLEHKTAHLGELERQVQRLAVQEKELDARAAQLEQSSGAQLAFGEADGQRLLVINRRLDELARKAALAEAGRAAAANAAAQKRAVRLEQYDRRERDIQNDMLEQKMDMLGGDEGDSQAALERDRREVES